MTATLDDLPDRLRLGASPRLADAPPPPDGRPPLLSGLEDDPRRFAAGPGHLERALAFGYRRLRARRRRARRPASAR